MAKKRANGEGSIRKRADGLWEARVVTGVDPDTGKTKRKSIYGKTQAEVRKKMTAVAIQVDSSIYVDPTTATVSCLMERWLNVHTIGLAPRTRNTYYTRYKKGIKPYIGNMKARDVTKLTVMSLYKKLATDENLCTSTIQLTHNLLSSAFSFFVDEGLLPRNPCEKTAKSIPKERKKVLVSVVDAKLDAFLNAIKGARDEKMCLLYLFTGLRQSELLGLTWGKIDFENRSIIIDQQLRRPTKGEMYKLTPTKNKKSRTIFPPDIVFEILIQQRREQQCWKTEAGSQWNECGVPDLVFTTRTGRWLNGESFRYRFKKLVASAGIPDARIHDLRHSYATLALASGVNVKIVQESLGHASAAFTLNRYTDVSTKMKDDQVACLNQLANTVLHQ